MVDKPTHRRLAIQSKDPVLTQSGKSDAYDWYILYHDQNPAGMTPGVHATNRGTPSSGKGPGSGSGSGSGHLHCHVRAGNLWSAYLLQGALVWLAGTLADAGAPEAEALWRVLHYIPEWQPLILALNLDLSACCTCWSDLVWM